MRTEAVLATNYSDESDALPMGGRVPGFERRLHRALEAADVGAWELELARRSLEGCNRFKAHFGRAPDATFAFDDLRAAVDAADLPRLEAALAASQHGGCDLDVEVVIVKPDGSRGALQLRARVVPGTGFSAPVLTGISLEVTRKRSNADHRHDSVMLRAVLQTVPGLVYAKDLGGRMLIANPPALALIGKPWEQVQGKTDGEFLDDPLQSRAVMDNDRRVMADGQPQVIEELVGSEAGRSRVWLSTKAPLRDDLGQTIGLVGISLDISERKRAEADLLRLNETLESRVAERTRALETKAAQLELANKELESFSYSISHDLRAPLRAIDGFCQIIQEDSHDLLDGEAQRCFEVIRENAHRMGTLIDDLLGFSRLSRVPIAAHPVSTESVVNEVLIELTECAAGARRCFDIGPLPASHGDRNLLRHVWRNLLANALKFSGNRAEPRIVIRGESLAEETRFSVSDNGVGFDMEYVDKLFGMFQRLHHGQDFEGTGVGLAVVHRIVTRHGGRVWAQGVVDHGAVFSFALPRDRSGTAVS